MRVVRHSEKVTAAPLPTLADLRPGETFRFADPKSVDGPLLYVRPVNSLAQDMGVTGAYVFVHLASGDLFVDRCFYNRHVIRMSAEVHVA